jgi:prepilin-type N-terminal cleavage/methylation domain-containing protein
MRKQAGYSLFELLSVVAILAVVVAIAVPNLNRAQRHYQLQSAAQQIAQVFQAAKLDAVGKSTSRKLVFNTTNNTITTSNGTVMALPAGIRFAALPSSLAAPNAIQTASANSSALPQQQSDAKCAVSFPAGSSAELCEANFTGRGLPDVEPGVLHWVYLVNQDEQHMAVTLTSVGGAVVLKFKDNTWQ